jgi:hypothetical protein
MMNGEIFQKACWESHRVWILFLDSKSSKLSLFACCLKFHLQRLRLFSSLHFFFFFFFFFLYSVIKIKKNFFLKN